MTHLKFIIACFFLLNTSLATAQVDPSTRWSVLKDKHAHWIYDSRHKDLAHQYAKHFRKLFPDLKAMFREIPEITTFVILDQTDMPNGSATVFPYPLVTVFPVIPVPNSPIGETEDSLFEILAHEYTHILNLYPVHGAMRPLSWVFGSIIRPNSYLPRWYAEGLAVYTESYFMPQGGRLRSQNFEGMVRAFTLDNKWDTLKIDQLNDFQPDWLGGRRAYLLGGALFHELVENKSAETIYSLNSSYSRRVPYFINAPLEKEIERSFSELLDTAYSNLSRKANQQLEPLKAAQSPRGDQIQQTGFENFYPSFSPDGRYLAYISRDHNVPSSVILQQATIPGAPATQIAFGVDILHLAWSPDSQIIAYNSIQRHKRFYTYSDIHLYNLKTQKTTQLTRGARAGSMVFSPDGTKIFYVQNTPGSKRLTEITLKTKQQRVIYDPKKIGTNLFGLVIDNDTLLFMEHHLNTRELRSLKMGDSVPQTRLKDKTISRLQKTPFGIVITSSRSGVDNLYLAKDTINTLESPKPLTNSLTRVLDGDIHPTNGSLVFAEQTSTGTLLHILKKSDWETMTTPPRVAPLLQVPSVQIQSESSQDGPLAEDKYSAARYMIPRYWMPFGSVIDGGIALQASTGSVDPLGKHAYTLGLEWDSLTKETGGTAIYTNNSTPVSLSAMASQVYRYNYTNASTLKDTSGAFSAGYSLPFMFRSWNVSLGWRHSNTEFSNATIERSGPTFLLGYNSAIQRGYEISPESGSALNLSNNAYIEDLGNIGYNKTNINWRHYFSKWLPSRHVLFTQINGTYAPELNSSALFTSTLNGSFASNLLIPPFLVRGYPSGNLLGNNMLSANLEYRFPLAYIYKGNGTLPLYFKTLHAAIVGDVVGLDGFRWSRTRSLNPAISSFQRERFGDEWYAGYGIELHLETTVGYYLPVKFSFGAYRGAERDLTSEDMSYFFAFIF